MALIDHFVDSKTSKSRSQTIGAGATISARAAFRARPPFVWTVASAVPLRRLAPTTFSPRSSPGGCGWERSRRQQPSLAVAPVLAGSLSSIPGILFRFPGIFFGRKALPLHKI
jgi:hypothetical protein